MAAGRVNDVLDPEHKRKRMLDLLFTSSVRYGTYTSDVSELREESGEVGLLRYYRFSYSRILRYLELDTR